MKDTSEDEQDDDFMASNSVNPRVSKSQSERAEQLRKMMEDESMKISASKSIDLVTNGVHRRRDGRHRG